ncbi:MAG: Holliday junction resolvase RecU [Lachnospiraceae bacterium]|nr:Holliday junction resolvase RecU [Lachnospiraceae bacterium]
MATWGKHGLRGSTLEDLINYTITRYRDAGLALIQKIPTPITPVNIDSATKHITLAYFDQKSTVDYLGVVQGIPICFDAKEVHVDTFSLQNVQEHQIAFMDDFEKQQGIAFFIIYYAHKNEFYYMPYRDMKLFWDRAEAGGRKSFTYDEMDKTGRIPAENSLNIHFLPNLQKDILERE